MAIYRVSIGAWYVMTSSDAVSYGLGGGGGSSDIRVTINLASIY